MDKDVVYPSREYRLAVALNSLAAVGRSMGGVPNSRDMENWGRRMLVEHDILLHADENRALKTKVGAVAAALGVPSSRLRKSMRELGFATHRDSGFRWNDGHDALLKSYATENGRLTKGIGTIAKKFGCSPSYISMKAKEMGLALLNGAKAQTSLNPAVTGESAE